MCECRELEEKYGSDFKTQILKAAEYLDGACVLREAENYIIKKDQALLLAEASQYHHLHKIALDFGWKKLLDHALDHGLHTVKGVKNLLRVITYPDLTTKKCPLCDTKEHECHCLPKPFVTQHTKSEGTWNTLLNSLITMDPCFNSHVL